MSYLHIDNLDGKETRTAIGRKAAELFMLRLKAQDE